MLFVAIALRQQPKLVATVVEPLVLSRWHVLSRELRVHEKISITVERHLHQTTAIFRDDHHLHPAARHQPCLPPLLTREQRKEFNIKRKKMIGGRKFLC